MRFRNILFLAILVPIVVTGIAVVAQAYLSSERNATDAGVRLLQSVTRQAGEQVQARSAEAVKLAENLRDLALDALALNDSDHLARQLLPLLRSHAGVTWITYSDPAGDFTAVYRDPQGVLCTNQSSIHDGKTAVVENRWNDDGSLTQIRKDPDSGYDPRERPFYIAAIAGTGVIWTQPYVFFNQKIPGISCATAVRANGKLVGVLSIDYDLRYLSEFARQARTSANSHIMIFSSDRILLAHSDAAVTASGGKAGDGKLLSLADFHDPLTAAFAVPLPQANVSHPEAMKPLDLQFDAGGAAYLASLTPIALEKGPTYYVAIIAPRSDFAPSAWQFSRDALVVVAIIMLISAFASHWISLRISAPLEKLMESTERIGKGDLNLQVNLGRLYEFRRLAGALHTMQAELHDWIRVRTSINIAMEIQRRLLPGAPPEIPAFDIAGYSAYCDETGGDYYDYLIIDPLNPKHFLVALGDVMGHGLPAALFMAGARGILRASAALQSTPSVLLERMNELLHRDTGGISFMTMFLANFDIDGDSCIWSSAGHDPLIIYDPMNKNFYEPEGGDLPLGVVGDTKYVDYRVAPISIGQVIFIGSDGVWEMTGENGDQFGKDRLKIVLAEHSASSATQIKTALFEALHQFRGSGPVKDDVTFVILKQR